MSPNLSSTGDKPSVLFVCLGNICRSTMGEGVLRSLVKKPEFKDVLGEIDSCGTGAYHIGEPPNSVTMSVLEDNGVNDYRHAARKIDIKDFDRFSYIFAMDRQNYRDILDLRKRRKNGEGKAVVTLFGAWGEKDGRPKKGLGEEVDDPYYGGRDGFERAYEQCMEYGNNFLKWVKEHGGEQGV